MGFIIMCRAVYALPSYIGILSVKWMMMWKEHSQTKLGNMVGLRDVITISEKGNGKGDCGKSRFVIDTVLNDARLTRSIPEEEVRKKFEVINEGFGKRAAPWYIWLVFLPLVAGLILLGLVEADFQKGVRCNKVTRVCNVTEEDPNFETCNKFWCCPLSPGWNNWFPKDPDEWSKKGCESLAGENRLKSNEYKSLAELCEDKVWMNSCIAFKRDRTETGVLRVQGFKNNFEWPLIDNSDYGKRVLPVHLLCWSGIFLFFSWCFFLYRTRMQKRFIKESFEDWKRIYGIETKYETKCCIPYTGMLYLKQSIEVVKE